MDIMSILPIQTPVIPEMKKNQIWIGYGYYSTLPESRLRQLHLCPLYIRSKKQGISVNSAGNLPFFLYPSRSLQCSVFSNLRQQQICRRKQVSNTTSESAPKVGLFCAVEFCIVFFLFIEYWELSAAEMYFEWTELDPKIN